MELDQLLYLGSLLLRRVKRFFRCYGWRLRRFFRDLLLDVLLIGSCSAFFMLICTHYFLH